MPRPTAAPTGLLFILLVFPMLPASPGAAQEVEVSVDAGINHALPPPGVAGPSATYLNGGLRLRLPGDGHTVFASAFGGASLAEGVGSWGWGTLGGRLSGRLSPELGWGLSLVGSGFSVGDPTPYQALTLRLRPELRLGVGDGVLVAGAAGGVARSEVGGGEETVETDLWSAGGDLELRAPVGGPVLRVGAGGTDGTAGTYGAAWLGLEGRIGPAMARGEVRGWSLPAGGTEITGSLRISVDLGASLAAWVAGGRSDPDPLLGTPPGDFVGSGVSWRVVAPDPAARLPARVVDRSEGRVRFELRGRDADRVVVVGDFSGWREVPLERRNGTWATELALEPGLYHYGFVVDGEWHVPDDVPGRTEDEWGRPTAVLLVPEPGGGGDGTAAPVTRRGSGSSVEREVAGIGRRPH